MLTHVQGQSGEPVPFAGADDVAKAILFLASDDAKTINGVFLLVDRAFGVT
jgi:NAD(P)-dependent dehydrogenase (short-subunit alcohol dehydrogenase family)